jgi:hypothetical protein
MNQISPSADTATLPEPGFPMVTRILSNPLFPPDPAAQNLISKDEPVAWIVGSPHPFVSNMTVVRMFIDPEDAVAEVYALAKDGRSGTRNLIPLSQIRLVEEAMPLDVFLEQLTEAEGGDEEEDPEPGEPEETSVRQPGVQTPGTVAGTDTVPINGYPATSS